MNNIDEVAVKIARSERHTILIGPPGVGKTMIARRVAEFRRPMPPTAGDASRIHRCMGLGPLKTSHVQIRVPHHSVSLVGVTGGPPCPRTTVPAFGELSLAHGGVLFLDELPEFRRDVLNAVLRAMQTKTTGRYLADFQLVAAMNPCPCGWGPGARCECSELSLRTYMERVQEFTAVCEIVNVGEQHV